MISRWAISSPSNAIQHYKLNGNSSLLRWTVSMLGSLGIDISFLPRFLRLWRSPLDCSSFHTTRNSSSVEAIGIGPCVSIHCWNPKWSRRSFITRMSSRVWPWIPLDTFSSLVLETRLASFGIFRSVTIERWTLRRNRNRTHFCCLPWLFTVTVLKWPV